MPSSPPHTHVQSGGGAAEVTSPSGASSGCKQGSSCRAPASEPLGCGAGDPQIRGTGRRENGRNSRFNAQVSCPCLQQVLGGQSLKVVTAFIIQFKLSAVCLSELCFDFFSDCEISVEECTCALQERPGFSYSFARFSIFILVISKLPPCI